MKRLCLLGIAVYVLAFWSTASIAAGPGIAINSADARYGEFVRAIAKPTAQAKTRDPDAIKFIGLGMNASGEVIVTEVALGADHGASMKMSADALVVAHVHNRHMSSGPEVADFDALKVMARPCFVISADGEKVWEVSIIDGSNRYREVMLSGTGQWQAFSPSQEK